VSSAANASGFSFDFSNFTNTASATLFVRGGAGNDVFLTGGSTKLVFSGRDGDDIFKVSALNFGKNTIFGQGGNDTLVLLDAGGPIADGKFLGSEAVDVDKIVLAAAKTGTTYDITLGDMAELTSLDTVDASAAGVFVQLTNSGFDHDLTVIGGAKGGNWNGGAGDDSFKFKAADFGTDDAINANNGLDTLAFTTGGVIAATVFDKVAGLEVLQLSSAGNTVTLSDHLIQSGDTQVALSGFGAFDFGVQGGIGNDKVDLSQITQTFKTIGVDSGGGGTDMFIGSAGDDSFLFLGGAKDLTSADVVKGGAGHDTVFLAPGTYGADIFKGLTSIEQISVADLSGKGISKFTLNNDSFKGADLADDGSKALTIEFLNGGHDHVVNAAAVTNATLGVKAIFDFTQDVTFIGGTGADTIGFSNVGHGGGDYALAAGDHVDGGAGRDTLLLICDPNFGGLGSVDDAAFAGVSHVESIAIQGAGALVIGALAQTAGIAAVDASQSGLGGVLILDASAFTNDLVVRGTTSHDQIKLGAGDDTIIGGGGNDLLEGGLGADTFVYLGASDSHFLTGHNKSPVDVITDFDHVNQGDIIDLTKLDLANHSVADLGFPANFTDLMSAVDAADFSASAVQIGNDGTAFYIFADADKNGHFDDNTDLVIKVSGISASDLTAGLAL
jgi:hypothetical protein